MSFRDKMRAVVREAVLDLAAVSTDFVLDGDLRASTELFFDEAPESQETLKRIFITFYCQGLQETLGGDIRVNMAYAASGWDSFMSHYIEVLPSPLARLAMATCSLRIGRQQGNWFLYCKESKNA